MDVLTRPLAVALALPAFLGACRPDLDERTSIVATPRVLAIRSEPAEVAPRGAVTLTALWADPSESPGLPPLDWAFCETRKPLSELGPVAPSCLARAGEGLSTLGEGATVLATVPAKACKNFGPEVPDPTKDAPAGRPVDPDVTGGYYQPVTLTVDDTFSIGAVRLTCGVVGASPDQLAQLSATSHPNQNPALDAVLANATPWNESAVMPVASGTTLTLRASWAACAPEAKGCSGAEHFAVYEQGTVVARREAIRVAWFASGGSFAVERNGRDEADEASFVENDWRPPPSGKARVWLVVRDSRGGVGWRSFTVEIR